MAESAEKRHWDQALLRKCLERPFLRVRIRQCPPSAASFKADPCTSSARVTAADWPSWDTLRSCWEPVPNFASDWDGASTARIIAAPEVRKRAAEQAPAARGIREIPLPSFAKTNFVSIFLHEFAIGMELLRTGNDVLTFFEGAF